MLDKCGCLASNYGEFGYRRLFEHNAIRFDRYLWSQVENSGKRVVGSLQQVAGGPENKFGNPPDKNEQDERNANIFGKDRCWASRVLLDRHEALQR
jgi:hypothetical protein